MLVVLQPGKAVKPINETRLLLFYVHVEWSIVTLLIAAWVKVWVIALHFSLFTRLRLAGLSSFKQYSCFSI